MMVRGFFPNLLQRVDQQLTASGNYFEGVFRSGKDTFHYRYLLVPFYKVSVSKIGSVAATSITFMIGGVIQQIGTAAGVCLVRYLSSGDPGKPSFYPIGLVTWTAIAVSVIYVKYKKHGLG